MKKIKVENIKEIEIYNVTDLEVYNLELKSNSEQDDLFYYDVESKLIHHNCLRKDFAMINESFPQTDIILQAYKINEYMPKFYADLVGDLLRDKKIGILGYAFKADVDDIRDSLAPKLIRYIERYIPLVILINDPWLPEKVTDSYDDYYFENKTVDEIIDKCDVIFVAINHSVYKKLHFKKGQTIVDIWGIFGQGIMWKEE